MAFPRMAGRLVSLLVVFCFIVNNLASHIPMWDIDSQTLAKALSAQSSLIQLCSLSTLPLKIVYNLMGIGDRAGSPSTPLSGKKQTAANDRPADCAVISPVPKPVAVKSKLFDQPGTGVVSVPILTRMADAACHPSTVPLNAWHILLLLAIIFYILARSGIPAASLSFARHFPARSTPLAGFFFYRVVKDVSVCSFY